MRSHSFRWLVISVTTRHEVTEVTGMSVEGHRGPEGRHGAQLDDAGAADTMASSIFVLKHTFAHFYYKKLEKISLHGHGVCCR
jgi:hypothetical protein